MSEASPIILTAPDAGNRSAGEALRVARQAQGLTLEGLAATIKVTPAKLEALEQGRYDLLPDASFTRALAMTVCRALKLDPAPVLASLPAAAPVSLATGKPPLNQPFKESRGGSPLFDKHMDWSALLSFKWLAPMALLLGAVLIYALPKSIEMPAWWHQLTQSPPPVVSQAASAAADEVASSPPVDAPVVAAPAPVPAAASAPASAVAAASVPAAPASGVVPLMLDSADGGTPGSAVAPPPPAAADPRLGNAPAVAGGATAGPVALSATASAWVEIRDANGQKVLSRHVKAGESVAVDGEAPLSLRIGNAAAVQLSFHGQAVDLAPHTRNNVARLELK